MCLVMVVSVCGDGGECVCVVIVVCVFGDSGECVW